MWAGKGRVGVKRRDADLAMILAILIATWFSFGSDRSKAILDSVMFVPV